MNRVFSFSLLVGLSASVAFAQYSPEKTLLSINNRKIMAGEFEQVYTKNYNINATEKQSVDEYFELFLKFRLKVSAAMDAGMDTSKAFKDEFASYRSQLAKSYLTDNSMLDTLIREAYEHTKTEVAVSHIMIRLSAKATPEDTLKAYQKALDVRKRLLAGESFEELAKKVSEDQSAATNGGYLGFSRAFRFPYSFEKAIYNSKKGEVSMPVRTQFGYHLILVKDSRLSRGEVRVAHIMVSVPRFATDSAQKVYRHKIDSIYAVLKNGADFKAVVASCSDDKNIKDGELPTFGAGRMVPEFEKAAFALQKPGDISEPVRTVAGWHIIKLLEQKPVAAYTDARNEIKNRLMNDERYNLVGRSYANKLRKTYTAKVSQDVLKNFYKLDSSVYKGVINVKPEILAKPILTIEKQQFAASAFKKQLESNYPSDTKISIKDHIDKQLNTFTDVSYVKYEDSQLETKFPEFKSLVNEYHDGILLFNIMDEKVWTKASRDTVGMESYYKNVWSKDKPEPKKLDEVKGLVTSDYQNYLEDKWVAELKNKYKIEINKELLAQISNKYKSKK